MNFQNSWCLKNEFSPINVRTGTVSFRLLVKASAVELSSSSAMFIFTNNYTYCC